MRETVVPFQSLHMYTYHVLKAYIKSKRTLPVLLQIISSVLNPSWLVSLHKQLTSKNMKPHFLLNWNNLSNLFKPQLCIKIAWCKSMTQNVFQLGKHIARLTVGCCKKKKTGLSLVSIFELLVKISCRDNQGNANFRLTYKITPSREHSIQYSSINNNKNVSM